MNKFYFPTPAPEAAFTDSPADITLTCEEALTFSPSPILYTNFAPDLCEITGSALPVFNPALVACGSSFEVTWSFTDNCGRTINETQLVTVSEASLPTWTNPPGNITITCAQAEIFNAPDLTYSNNESGLCLISDQVAADITNNYSECGGTITVTYSATDVCGRVITPHIQTITVTPAPPDKAGAGDLGIVHAVVALLAQLRDGIDT